MKKAILLGLLFCHVLVQAEVVHEERSLYQNIYVIEEDGMRCLRFKLKTDQRMSQSCIDISAPENFIFDYYKQAMGANFFIDQPKKILIIGLGGGILANAYEFLYPQAAITSVEIDPVVVKMARRYFNYQKDTERRTTHVMDGRVFVKRALKKDQRYDLIVLDAFNADYIPEHMMTKEYLIEVKSLLEDGGIVMANTFSHSKLFDHESATYASVFGDIYQISIENDVFNRVIIAGNQPLPPRRSLLKKASGMQGELQYFGVDVFQIYDALSNEVNWDVDARILTDQYSPANLLKEK